MRELNETELLCIKRLTAKKVPTWDIADRLSLNEKELQDFLKQRKKENARPS